VRSIDRGGYALLSRDHSGPWQGLVSPDPTLNDPTLPNAMQDVKDSLSDDIRNGFDLLHIDPSLALIRGFSEDDVDEMAVELIAHCVGEMTPDRPCAFEVGTDEQDLAPDPIPLSRMRLRRLLAKLDHYRLPRPIFYVVQTGTKVMESRNIGSFDQPITLQGSLPPAVHLPSTIDMCLAEGVLLKEHNADYLSDRALKWHRRFGIHAANVAPEFGVTETSALLEILSNLRMHRELDTLTEIVLGGGRWGKWILPNSTAGDLERVRIAGHYHFSDPEIREIREKAAVSGRRKGIDTEHLIGSRVRESIKRYMVAFGYGDKT